MLNLSVIHNPKSLPVEIFSTCYSKTIFRTQFVGTGLFIIYVQISYS